MTDDAESWLPPLRRLARAATGDAERGDDAVRRCVERLLAEHPDGPASREQAFAALARTLAEVEQVAPGPALMQLPLAQRLAYLLTRLEELAPEDAARALGLTPRRLSTLVASALATLGRPEPARVLIIEDEPATALDLEEIVERDGHAVLGIASTHGEAVDLARAEPPALILADIRLADDSSGVDAVNDINAAHAVPAVYVTAFPDEAVAETGPGTLVVAKPFTPQALTGAIDEALAVGPRGA
ncbi:MAG TPA: response regulator [Geminicoccaceae bacterium]|nr:response regulator [Geminicoccus sp.]HMU51082.1 response regulator [Geminicoccaceae bacterium]